EHVTDHLPQVEDRAVDVEHDQEPFVGLTPAEAGVVLRQAAHPVAPVDVIDGLAEFAGFAVLHAPPLAPSQAPALPRGPAKPPPPGGRYRWGGRGRGRSVDAPLNNSAGLVAAPQKSVMENGCGSTANMASVTASAPAVRSSTSPARASVEARTPPRRIPPRLATSSTRSGSSLVRRASTPSGPPSSATRPAAALSGRTSSTISKTTRPGTAYVRADRAAGASSTRTHKLSPRRVTRMRRDSRSSQRSGSSTGTTQALIVSTRSTSSR